MDELTGAYKGSAGGAMTRAWGEGGSDWVGGGEGWRRGWPLMNGLHSGPSLWRYAHAVQDQPRRVSNIQVRDASSRPRGFLLIVTIQKCIEAHLTTAPVVVAAAAAAAAPPPPPPPALPPASASSVLSEQFFSSQSSRKRFRGPLRPRPRPLAPPSNSNFSVRRRFKNVRAPPPAIADTFSVTLCGG